MVESICAKSHHDRKGQNGFETLDYFTVEYTKTTLCSHITCAVGSMCVTTRQEKTSSHMHKCHGKGEKPVGKAASDPASGRSANGSLDRNKQ